MIVMIDPTNVRGAFTGGAVPQQQDPQLQATVQAAPSQQPTNSGNDDALAALELLVAESAQVTPPLAQPTAAQTPQSSEQPDAMQPAPQEQVATTPPPQPQAVSTNQPVDPVLQQPADPSAQAVIASMQTLPDSLNPPNPAPTSAKETFERPAAPDASSIDVGGAVQHVEVEKNPELPVEVEGFLQRVQDFSAQPPQEIVIADGTNEQATTNYPSRPVIVLPITEEEEKAGRNKSPRNSIRWLVEWSHKVIRMFAGKVIYRHVDQK